MRDSPFERAPDRTSARRQRPRWDRAAGRLWVGGECVFQRTRRARNQELILDALEELGWPRQIDDPLPGGCDDPRDRLHQTLKKLNRNQSPQRIRFFRDGSGEGISWELLPPPRPGTNDGN